MNLDHDTKKFEQTVIIKSGLDAELNHKDYLIAKNLAWFPDTPRKDIYIVPDIMVTASTKLHQTGNKKWIEGDIKPLAIFEIIDSTDTFTDLLKKYQFYEKHGVQEYYLLNPESQIFEGWLLENNTFNSIKLMDGFKSPNLGIRFQMESEIMELYHTNGQKFATYSQIRAEMEKRNQDQREFYRHTTENKIRSMVKKLKEMGINPDSLPEE